MDTPLIVSHLAGALFLSLFGALIARISVRLIAHFPASYWQLFQASFLGNFVAAGINILMGNSDFGLFYPGSLLVHLASFMIHGIAYAYLVKSPEDSPLGLLKGFAVALINWGIFLGLGLLIVLFMVVLFATANG